MTTMLPALSDHEIFESDRVTSQGILACPTCVSSSALVVADRDALFKTGGLNEVTYCALDEDDADASRRDDRRVSRARPRFGERRSGQRTSDPGAALRGEARGSWGRGMARSTSDLPEARDPAIQVAVDATTIAQFARDGEAEHGARADRDPERAHPGDPGPPAAPLPRVLRCELAAVASYVVPAVGVPDRRRGAPAVPRPRLARARPRALADARRRDILLATSHARESTSAPILERLGFETICRMPMYFG
jgi:hypothetical protein